MENKENKSLDTISTCIEFEGRAVIAQKTNGSKVLRVPLKVKSWATSKDKVNDSYFANITFMTSDGKKLNGLLCKKITDMTPTQLNELPLFSETEKKLDGSPAPTKVELAENKNFVAKNISIKPYKLSDGTIKSDFIMSDLKTELEPFKDEKRYSFYIPALTDAKIENDNIVLQGKFNDIGKKESDVTISISKDNDLGQELIDEYNNNGSISQTFFYYYNKYGQNAYDAEKGTLILGKKDFTCKTISQVAIDRKIKEVYAREQKEEKVEPTKEKKDKEKAPKTQAKSKKNDKVKI